MPFTLSGFNPPFKDLFILVGMTDNDVYKELDESERARNAILETETLGNFQGSKAESDKPVSSHKT